MSSSSRDFPTGGWDEALVAWMGIIVAVGSLDKGLKGLNMLFEICFKFVSNVIIMAAL